MPSPGLHHRTTSSPPSTTSKHRSLPPPLLKELLLHSPSLLTSLPETLTLHHTHRVGTGQATSAVVRRLPASVSSVWSIVRRFDNPLVYKRFLKSCRLVDSGDVAGVGSLREVHVVSGLPAAWSTERLDVFDEERHVIGFSVVDGVHRLENYRSVMTLHEDGSGGTVVVESYVVDVPEGNTTEDTCTFADTILRCNLNALEEVVAGKVSGKPPIVSSS